MIRINPIDFDIPSDIEKRGCGIGINSGWDVLTKILHQFNSNE
jgi:hypothetical protein